VLILEHSYYSVISPEGCAAILWKDRAYADQAAAALKIAPRDLLAAGLVDDIVPEPEGGAHTNHAAAAENLRAALLKHLAEVSAWAPQARMDKRYAKFRAMGVFAGG